MTLRFSKASASGARICLFLHGKVSRSLPNRQKTYNIELFWRVILGQRSLRNLRMPVTCFITAETVQDRTSWRKIQYSQDGLVSFCSVSSGPKRPQQWSFIFQGRPLDCSTGERCDFQISVADGRGFPKPGSVEAPAGCLAYFRQSCFHLSIIFRP